MKTLSTDQVKQIENFLITQYNIKYQDTRDEVLDHIACEVEELMTSGYEYQTAFQVTFDKWNKHLRPLKIFNIHNIPSFLAKPWIIRDTIIAALIALLGSTLSFVYGNAIIENSSPTLIVVTVFLFSSLITWYSLTQHNHKSNYRIVLLKNNIKLFQLVITLYCLISSIPVTHFGYNNLPIIFLICLAQLYYLIEMRKTKSYKTL